MLEDAAERKYSSHELSHTLFRSCCWRISSAQLWSGKSLLCTGPHTASRALWNLQISTAYTIKKKKIFLQCFNCTPSDTWLWIALANNCTSMNIKFVWPKRNWSCLQLKMNTAKLQLTHLSQTVLSGLRYLYTTHSKTFLEALDLKDQHFWANWSISLFRLNLSY